MQQTILPSASPVMLINPPGLYDPSANGYSHVAMLAPGTRIAYHGDLEQSGGDLAAQIHSIRLTRRARRAGILFNGARQRGLRTGPGPPTWQGLRPR